MSRETFTELAESLTLEEFENYSRMLREVARVSSPSREEVLHAAVFGYRAWNDLFNNGKRDAPEEHILWILVAVSAKLLVDEGEL